MIGKIFVLVVVAAACDAGLTSLYSGWPSQTAASTRTSTSLGYMPGAGAVDYNQLLHVLYPEVSSEPQEDMTTNLLGGYNQMGTGYEMSDMYKPISSGIRASSRFVIPSREIGYGPLRGSGRPMSYDDYRVGELRERRGYDDCRNCGELRGNCECGDFSDERGNCDCRRCGEEICMNDCKGCCNCRSCSQQTGNSEYRSNYECRGCGNQRNMECRNCCDSGECYSDCGSVGCSSRSGSNYNRCGSFGCGSQRNMHRSSCRCTKMQGQCCSSSMCR